MFGIEKIWARLHTRFFSSRRELAPVQPTRVLPIGQNPKHLALHDVKIIAAKLTSMHQSRIIVIINPPDFAQYDRTHATDYRVDFQGEYGILFTVHVPFGCDQLLQSVLKMSRRHLHARHTLYYSNANDGASY